MRGRQPYNEDMGGSVGFIADKAVAPHQTDAKFGWAFESAK